MAEMVCAVYARVSTDMQGESLDNQVQYAKEYISRLGEDYTFDDALTYTDFDQSGYYTRFIDRPAIQQALTDAEARKYHVIVFKEISRISRDQMEHGEIVTRFTQNGVRVIAINDHLDSAKPETLSLLGIHSVFSEMESQRISTRVSSGKKSLARKGYWIGEAPIGYRVNPETRRLEVDDDYADIPRVIFQLFTESGLGTFKIAEYLNTHSLLSKNGNLWSRVTVNRVLKNPAYTGTMVYGRTRNRLAKFYDENDKYRKVKTKSHVSPNDWVIIENAHPKLVDETTFDLAQSVMAKRVRQKARRISHPLTGILKCGRCGSGMICQKRTYRRDDKEIVYRYYYCSRQFKFGRTTCDQPSVNADKLEKSIWTLLVKMLAEYENGRVNVKQRGDDAKALDRRIAKLERDLAKARLAYSRLLADDTISQETFAALKTEHVESIRTLEAEIARVTEQSHVRDQRKEHETRLREYLSVVSSLDLSDLDRMRKVFHELIDSVIVDGLSVTELIPEFSLS